jgi:hypothetical protein
MIGFILTRHVNSVETNRYWIECVKQIRLFYPTNYIIIVDDNSNRDIINMQENMDFLSTLTNYNIVESEHIGRGEILAYYYFYILGIKLFDKAVILHDSTFIHCNLDVVINQVNSIRFIWNFKSVPQNVVLELKQIYALSNNRELVSVYKRRHLWNGCFGVMSVISYDFLKQIVEKYNLFNLLEHIKCRLDRMAFERVFSVVCHNENRELIKRSSILGSIHHYIKLGYTFNEYIRNKKQNKYAIVKVWTGR